MPRKPKLPKCVRTLAGIANLIREHFKMPCDKMRIKNWQTRHTPPFPYPKENNEFDVAECFKWVEALQKRKGAKGQLVTMDMNLESLDVRAAEAHAKKKITSAEREQFEFEKEKGEWIKRDIAEQTICAAMREYHKFVRQEVEFNNPIRRKEKLVELGASPELLAKFFEYDVAASIATLDRIEKKCES